MKPGKFYFTAISFLLFQFTIGNAQTSDTISFKNQFSIHSGLEHNLYLDDQATPLIYRGNGVQTGIEYKRCSDVSEIEVALGSAAMRENAKYHEERTLYITPLEYIPELDITGDTLLHARILPAKLPHFSLNFAGFRKKAVDPQKKMFFFFGAGLASNMRIPTSDNVIVFTPIWLNDINAIIKYSYQINPVLRIKSGVSLPLFAMAVRLPYSISPVEPNKGIYSSALSNCKLVSWNKYQSANLFLEIAFRLNKKLVIELKANCYYLRYSSPASIHFFQTNSTLGITYPF